MSFVRVIGSEVIGAHIFNFFFTFNYLNFELEIISDPYEWLRIVFEFDTKSKQKFRWIVIHIILIRKE